jgi:hypothetical protein
MKGCYVMALWGAVVTPNRCVSDFAAEVALFVWMLMLKR